MNVIAPERTEPKTTPLIVDLRMDDLPPRFCPNPETKVIQNQAHSQTAARRGELKYVLTEKEYHAFRSAIKEYVEPDLFACSHICSLYLDTPDNAMIRHSLEKPRYKEKLRIRAYSADPQLEDPCFLEIKKKVQGTVYKRRVEMTLAEALLFTRSGIYPEKTLAGYSDADRRTAIQMLREAEWLFSLYGDLRPSFSISCERQSIKERGTDSLRITFDHEIHWSYKPLKGIPELGKHALIEAQTRVMEIKCTKGMPFWLIDALNAQKIYPRSFSKVGKSYQAWSQKTKG